MNSQGPGGSAREEEAARANSEGTCRQSSPGLGSGGGSGECACTSTLRALSAVEEPGFGARGAHHGGGTLDRVRQHVSEGPVQLFVRRRQRLLERVRVEVLNLLRSDCCSTVGQVTRQKDVFGWWGTPRCRAGSRWPFLLGGGMSILTSADIARRRPPPRAQNEDLSLYKLSSDLLTENVIPLSPTAAAAANISPTAGILRLVAAHRPTWPARRRPCHRSGRGVAVHVSHIWTA